jgi:hypothetical protein
LPRYAVLIVATGDSGNRRRIGPQVADRCPGASAAVSATALSIAPVTAGFPAFSALSATRSAALATRVGGRTAAFLRDLALLPAHLTVEVTERLVEFFVAALATATTERIVAALAAATATARIVAALAAGAAGALTKRIAAAGAASRVAGAVATTARGVVRRKITTRPAVAIRRAALRAAGAAAASTRDIAIAR